MKKEEYLKTNSNKSSMRLVFVWTIRAVIILSFISVIGSLILTYLGKKADLLGIGGILGLLAGTSFGGKVGQSFAERKTTNTESTEEEPCQGK